MDPEVRDSFMQEYLMKQGLDQVEQQMTDEEKTAVNESSKSWENMAIQNLDDLTRVVQGDMQNGSSYAILQAVLLDYYHTYGKCPSDLSALDTEAAQEHFVLPPEMDVRYEQRAGGDDSVLQELIYLKNKVRYFLWLYLDWEFY